MNMLNEGLRWKYILIVHQLAEKHVSRKTAFCSFCNQFWVGQENDGTTMHYGAKHLQWLDVG